MMLIVLKNTSQELNSISCSLVSCDVFFIIILGLRFGEEDHRDELPFSTHHLAGTCYHHDLSPEVGLEDLVEVLFARCLQYKVTSLPPPTTFHARGYRRPLPVIAYRQDMEGGR
jgi:hypothetical protein